MSRDVDQRNRGSDQGQRSHRRGGDGAATGRRGRRVVKAARLVVAGLVAGTATGLVWRAGRPSLTGPIDVVGYSTFNDFNYLPPLWTYRLIAFVFPALFVASYLLLRQFGPLRRTSGSAGARAVVRLVEEPVGYGRWWPGAPLRVALPALLLAVGVASRGGVVDAVSVGWAVGYVLGVTLMAAAWVRFGRFAPARWQRYGDVLSAVNGVAAGLAAMLAVWLVSAHTAVLVGPERTRIAHSWLAGPLAVGGLAAIPTWALWQRWRGLSARRIERLLLVVVAGSAALFLAGSSLPGDLATFEGYDDSHEKVGAALRGLGELPWRDFLFNHGLFNDVLAGTLGRSIFGDTAWGISAAGSVLLIPLCWVGTYLFAVWLSRANPWFAALTACLVLTGLLPRPPDVRFLALPLALIVLGETVRRRAPAWCALLVAVLLGQVVLAPEAVFLVVPALATIVAADIVHRGPGETVWASLQMTRWSAVAGVVGCAALAAYLAAIGALRGFVDFFIIVGPGHEAEGALPLGSASAGHWAWLYVCLAVALLTVWSGLARLLRRGDWRPQDWVAVAVAGQVAFYAEKALSRSDDTHLEQVSAVAAPLLLYWVWYGLTAAGKAADRFAPSSWWADRDATARRARAGYALTAVSLVAFVASLAVPLANVAARISGDHITAVSAPDPTFPRIGYAKADAVDTARLTDLDRALRAYAGPTAPVFDMTNSMGFVHYLLGRVPPTRFPHVSMAITRYAQRLLIDDLERTRPPVVIFDAPFGQPGWDRVPNYVRNYEIARYVLTGWVPVLRTNGVLLLLRRDLVGTAGTAAPPAPAGPVATRDLWFSGPPCDWGAVPNFLPAQPSGTAIKLPVGAHDERLQVDMRGWSVDPQTRRPATVVLASGDRVVGSTAPTEERSDLAFMGPAATRGGFRYEGVVSFDAPVAAYLLGSTGVAYPMVGSPSAEVASLALPDGGHVRVIPQPAGGIEYWTTSTRQVGVVDVPRGVRPADFSLATLATDGAPLGATNVHLTDDLQAANHGVIARSLASSGPRLRLRVGSCLPWHGFSSGPLYVVQDGGAPVTSVTLSGLAD